MLVITQEKLISPVSGSNIEAERNNNFSPEAAIAEIIDNSIEADAKNIKIKIVSKAIGSQTVARPQVIAVGDDGEGMDGDGEDSTLQESLILGKTTRRNSRKGLGRFGVGMTKGAISLCRMIEVYSRKRQGNWNYVKMDLDIVDENGDPGITVAKKAGKLPEDYKHLVGDKGTLVIWTKIDRIETDFKIEDVEIRGVLHEGLTHWLERTFRKYIGEKIIEDEEVVDNPNTINLEFEHNGENRKLVAFDPMFVIPNSKRAEDGTAELDWEDTFSFEIGDVDKPDEPVSEGNITIRMSLTPKEWRMQRKHGNSTESRARHMPNNEGISILRNGREVAYRKIDNWDPKPDQHDRWWSCEIDFDPVLDHQFKVANVKIGAKPILELREKLQEKITGTIENFRKEIQDHWKKQDPPTAASAPITQAPISVIPPTQQGEITPEEEEELAKEEGWAAFREVLMDPQSPGVLLYPTEEMDSKDPMIETTTHAGKFVVKQNLMHVWWDSLYEKMDKVRDLAKEEGNDVEISLELDKIKLDIDHLMIAIGKTMKDMKGQEMGSMEDTFETIIFKISQISRALTNESVSSE